MRRESRVGRRDVLALGAASLAGLAGCLGGERDGSGESGGSTATTGESSKNTDITQSLSTHAAATDLESQPIRGPDPLDATATIIAFEDPSCTRCRAFEQNVVPKLESDIESGTLSFVSRTYPVVYQWGKPAVQALEATFNRDEAAYWGLFSHYFEEQDAFSTENVLDRTRTWLARNTDLDAEAIVADAKAKAFDDAVQADLAAGDEAGANGVTPSLFLFRDGQYRTTARGSVSYDVIANTLEL
ncbi:Protein-disulfide isomerase [Halogranum rubrum]|uniref:Protein-disulfide isomerase n=1 Tax=Halogranum rubrum TaxID=553466 RepID=A0A1I4CLI9_9EURY|nr:thioredoxin domain-containing protein [Halogranum rubrum]SFK82132.1 Protein-disulfide isomerase [Halogranum rubrum]